MKRQLKPVTGLLLAGLVGAAYAECYMGVSGTCGVGSGQEVGYQDVGGCYRYIYAMGTWSVLDIPQAGAMNGWTGLKYNAVCHGPASYIDCQGYPATIQDYTPGPGWETYYTAVDTSSPECHYGK